MQQLYKDLVAIRTQKQMSVQDVHDQTRIAIYNIEQIENGMLFESDRNPTYIRTFVRTYGKCLGIPLDEMSRALDLMNEGKYDGFLARKYLHDADTSSPGPDPESGVKAGSSPTEQPEAGPASDVGQKAPGGVSDDTPETAESSAQEDTGSPKKPDDSLGPEKKETTQALPDDSQKSPESPAKPSSGKKDPDTAPPRRVLDGSSIQPGYGTVGDKKKAARDVDWSQLRKDARKPGSGLSIQLIAGIVAIVLLLAGLTYWLTLPEDNLDAPAPQIEAQADQIPAPESETEEIRPEAEPPPLSSDTLDAPVPPDPSVTAVAVADTMEVVVYAATGNLDPFRVQSDTFEQRRPYWVEQGQGMRIRFINEMRLSSNLGNMLVLYDGRVLNTFDEASTATERVITRSLFEEAESMEAITDEGFPEGVEPPAAVQDRPVIE